MKTYNEEAEEAIGRGGLDQARVIRESLARGTTLEGRPIYKRLRALMTKVAEKLEAEAASHNLKS